MENVVLSATKKIEACYNEEWNSLLISTMTLLNAAGGLRHQGDEPRSN